MEVLTLERLERSVLAQNTNTHSSVVIKGLVGRILQVSVEALRYRGVERPEQQILVVVANIHI